MGVEGTISMSRKERKAYLAMEKISSGEFSRKEASEALGIGYRQVCRKYQRYKEKGAAGLVHGLRGRRGNRGIKERVWEEMIGLYQTTYEGFGPRLFSEKLRERHGIEVHEETARRVLAAEGLWKVRKKKGKGHAPWRERKKHFGEMVQMDGSHHRWFGKERQKSCLMVMIDDATGERMALMAEEETTRAAMRLLRKWIRKYGVPKSLYVDKKNVYVPSKKDQTKAELEGRKAHTQFSRACEKLGTDIIPAHSPEAKGRVERANGVYQDRFVKEMMLDGITEIEGANRLLDEGGFDEDLNRRFAVEPARKADYHRPLFEEEDLDEILSIQSTRKLTKKWTFSFETRLYRIRGMSKLNGPATRDVFIKRYLDGTLHIFYRGKDVQFEVFIPEPKKSAPKPPKTARGNIHRSKSREKLPPDHPWTGFQVAKRDKTRPYFL